MNELELMQLDCRTLAEEAIHYSSRRSVSTYGRANEESRTYHSLFERLREEYLPFSDENSRILVILNESGIREEDGGLTQEEDERLTEQLHENHRMIDLCAEYVRCLGCVENYFRNRGNDCRFEGHPHSNLSEEARREHETQIREMFRRITRTTLSREQLEQNILELHRAMEEGPLQYNYTGNDYACNSSREFNLQRALENAESRRRLNLPIDL